MLSDDEKAVATLLRQTFRESGQPSAPLQRLQDLHNRRARRRRLVVSGACAAALVAGLLAATSVRHKTTVSSAESLVSIPASYRASLISADDCDHALTPVVDDLELDVSDFIGTGVAHATVALSSKSGLERRLAIGVLEARLVDPSGQPVPGPLVTYSSDGVVYEIGARPTQFRVAAPVGTASAGSYGLSIQLQVQLADGRLPPAQCRATFAGRTQLRG